MLKKQNNHVCVIGSGIVGICTALHLMKKKWSVSLIDPNGPASKASSGNAGLLAASHVTPVSSPAVLKQVPGMLLDPNSSLVISYSYLPRLIPWLFRFVIAGRPKKFIEYSKNLSELLKDTYSAYEPLVDEANCSNLIKRKGLIIALTSDESLEKIKPELSLKKSLGVKFEIYNKDKIKRILPDLDSIVKHAIFYENVSHITDPYMFAIKLFDNFKKQGGKHYLQEVKSFKTEKNLVKSVITDQDEIPTNAVVVCAGAWSKKLASQLGANVPLETERGYSVSLPNPGINISYPVISGDLRFCATPMGDSLRLAGTVELASIDAPAKKSRYSLMIKHALRLFPSLNLTGASYWMGHRPSMPDSLPVIGKSPIYENGYFAFGHGHIGLTVAAVTGKIIAELASSGKTSIDIKPFDSNRF